MKKSFAFWAYFFIALITPRFVLKFAREVYLYAYALLAKVDDNDQIVRKIQSLESHYLRSKQNVLGLKGPIFSLQLK